MIRLSQDGKTLVSVGSWEEVYELPGFVEIVDANLVNLTEIIGQYTLPERNPCGLKNCRTPHNRGYVIKVGSEGAVTNIGNVCGKKHLGVEFDKQKNVFTQAVNAQRYRINIAEKQRLVPELLARLQRMRDNGADEAYKKMHGQMTRLFDEATSKALRRIVKKGNGEIARAVQLSEEERELELGYAADADYRTEIVYRVRGFRAATSYARLSPRKLGTFEAELEAFAEIDADSLGFKELRDQHNFANGIDAKIDELEEILTDCQRFLVPDNIASIVQHKEDLKRS